MRLIDADELTRRIEKSYLTSGEKRLFIIKVRHMPSIETLQSEWIEVDIKPTPYGGYTCNRKCKRCNYFTKEYRLNYCPNCGAYMKGGLNNG